MPTDFTEIRNWIAQAKLEHAMDGLEADLAQRDRTYALYRKQLANYRQQLSATERSDETTQEVKQNRRNQLTKRLLELIERLEANEPPPVSDRVKDLAQTGGYVLILPLLIVFAGAAWLVESVAKKEAGGIFVALLLIGLVLGGFEGRNLSGSLDDFSFYKSYVKRYTKLQTSALDSRTYLYTPDRSYRYHPDTGVELVPPNDKIAVAQRSIAADRRSPITTGAAAMAIPAEQIRTGSTLVPRAAAGGAAGFAILYVVSRNPFTYLRQIWRNLSVDRQTLLIVAGLTGLGVGYLGGKWLFTRKEPSGPTDAVLEPYYADPEMMAAVYADKAGVRGNRNTD
jgi:hypothetical protein